MTCNSCVAKAKSALLMLGDVTEAQVQLAAPQATISMQKHIPLAQLQAALSRAGAYTISANESMSHAPEQEGENKTWLDTYKPILLVFAFITGITLLVQWKEGFEWEVWMRYFMAAFFLTFSFFKLLNLKGFAESYASYDIIAKRWMGWGYIYAFIELGLGIAYLLNFQPLLTNGVSFAVMSLSLVGVVRAVLQKRKIQCACLGAVFNLPMSTITIMEDVLMMVMSGYMLLMLW